jgi:amino acid adenylation domain-containing protein
VSLDATVPGVVERLALATPDAPAVVAVAVRLTYAELLARASGVARSLAEAGVAPGGERVAMLCERGADVPVAMLGVLLAGAVLVPLDPLAPPARNRCIAERAACRAVVTNFDAPDLGVRAVRLGSASGVAFEPRPRRSEDAACVMFTSGSTGEPKGVVVPHRAIVRLCLGNWFLRADASTRFLHVSSPAFDASTLEVWAPLLSGGAVVVAPPGRIGLREIGETIREHGVTACFLTTSLFNAMVDERPEAFETLSVVLTGGEAMSPRHAARLRARLPGLRIVNAYGPTENTTFTTCHEVGEPDPEAPVPIGLPIAGSGVAVLDAQGGLAPLGEAGELAATGEGLALGYLGDQAETSRRFVTIPGLGVRAYRTGDRGRMGPDGVVEFAGRSDEQVKIRGHRVEPAEVEAVLRRQPGVLDAVAIAAADARGERALVAMVTTTDGADWARLRPRLRKALGAALPEAFVPRAIARLERLPLGPTGKADRAGLLEVLERGAPVEGASRESLGDDPAAALGAAAIALARLWRPFEPGAVALVGADGRRTDLPVECAPEDDRALPAFVRARLGPDGPEPPLRAELLAPEGRPASLELDGMVRLRLPWQTGEPLGRWRLAHASAALERVLGGGVSALSAEEAHAIESWCFTLWDGVPRAALPDLFERSARGAPEAEALRSDRLSLNSGQVLRRVDGAARALLEAGVRPGDRVGVYDRRSVESIIGVLGVLRAGCVCVPLDPGQPPTRTMQMIEDAGVSCLLGEALAGEAAPERVVAPARGASSEPSGVPIDPASDAFVLFTSGSTGRRKGVPIRHESIVNRIAWMHDRFGLSRADLVAQKNRLGWDVSMWEYLWPLCFGGRALVIDSRTASDPARLHECLRRNGVTVMHCVPSLMAPLARAARAAGRPGLRLTIASGEKLPASSAREYLEAVGGELHNLYGPTEAAIDVTAGHVEPGDETVTIGRPIANVRVEVIDPSGQPCPVGVAGELRLGGVQVSRGYCEAPGVSSAPFSEAEVRGVRRPTYRTGDLARWREDGEIEFLGRRDGQVQLFGLRIEPEEVEAALMACPDVAEAAVCLLGEGLGAHLVGVCAARTARAEGLDGRVRAALRGELDSALIPTRLVWVDALPRLASGKIDRAGVAGLAHAAAPEVGGHGATRSTAETVASVWAELLGAPPASPEADFMAEGGNSITFLRLVLEVERRLGLELPAAPAMARPTLGGIVEVVEAVAREAVSPGGNAGPEAHRGGELVRVSYGRIPLVVLPHLGGTLGFLGDVAALLAGRVGMHGVLPRGLFDGETPVGSFEEIVSHDAALIGGRSWPGGVCLLGFSSGAALGVGLAAALRERGIAVPLLVLVDSSPSLGSLSARVRRLVKPARRAARRVLGRSAEAPDEHLGAHVSESQRRLMRAHFRALTRYRPPAWDGPTLVVTTRRSRREHGARAWAGVARGPTEEVVLDASHMDMWEGDSAPRLAEHLAAHLSRAWLSGAPEAGPARGV